MGISKSIPLKKFDKASFSSALQKIKPKVIQCCTAPREISPDAAEALKSIALAKGLSITSTQMVDDDTSLFPDSTLQPQLSLDTPITPESLVLVHMTRYFPQNGKILSAQQATKDEAGVSAPRSTIHFCLNKSVTEHEVGDSWGKMPYSIIIPFKGAMENIPQEKILGEIQEDFFIQDELKLPEGSVILRYNENIPEGKLKISQAQDNGQIFKGVKLVETSSTNMGKVSTRVLQKMGFKSMEDINKESGVSNQENLINSMNVENIADNLGLPKAKEKTEHEKNVRIHGTKLRKIWNDFCKENNYIQGLHSSSPWGRSEMIINFVDALEKTSNSWQGEDSDGNQIDYKQEFSKILDECVEYLPQGKKLSFDPEKVKEIIQTSPDPQTALKEFAEKLKIKPLELPEDKKTNIDYSSFSKSIIYQVIDMVIGISENNKKAIKGSYTV